MNRVKQKTRPPLPPPHLGALLVPVDGGLLVLLDAVAALVEDVARVVHGQDVAARRRPLVGLHGSRPVLFKTPLAVLPRAAELPKAGEVDSIQFIDGSIVELSVNASIITVQLNFIRLFYNDASQKGKKHLHESGHGCPRPPLPWWPTPPFCGGPLPRCPCQSSTSPPAHPAPPAAPAPPPPQPGRSLLRSERRVVIQGGGGGR